MANSEALLDAVQAYFFEVVDTGCSQGRMDEIRDQMREALYLSRPEAINGPPKAEPPATAPPIPEESEK